MTKVLKINKARKKQYIVYFECDYCGIIHNERKSHYDKTKRHFCSMICYSNFRKHKLTIEEQHAFKGVGNGRGDQEYHRRYVKNNPDRISHLKSRRYAREKGCEGNHSLKEWETLKDQFKNKCALCGSDSKLTKDHIIPLSKGGTDYISNIQPLCKSCNSKKHNKINYIHDNPELITT